MRQRNWDGNVPPLLAAASRILGRCADHRRAGLARGRASLLGRGCRHWRWNLLFVVGCPRLALRTIRALLRGGGRRFLGALRDGTGRAGWLHGALHPPAGRGGPRPGLDTKGGNQLGGMGGLRHGFCCRQVVQEPCTLAPRSGRPGRGQDTKGVKQTGGMGALQLAAAAGRLCRNYIGLRPGSGQPYCCWHRRLPGQDMKGANQLGRMGGLQMAAAAGMLCRTYVHWLSWSGQPYCCWHRRLPAAHSGCILSCCRTGGSLGHTLH